MVAAMPAQSLPTQRDNLYQAGSTANVLEKVFEVRDLNIRLLI